MWGEVGTLLGARSPKLASTRLSLNSSPSIQQIFISSLLWARLRHVGKAKARGQHLAYIF